MIETIKWHLKQLFPFTYRTTYADKKGKHFVVWNMFMGTCYNIEDHLMADSESI